MAKFKTTEWFIEKANKTHGDKYNYSKTKYISSKTKVTIICPIHGEFYQTPSSHLNGCGCYTCARKLNGSKTRSNTDTFIEKSIAIHGDRYEYSLVEYETCLNEVSIICRRHGVFKQKPKMHLWGCDCPKCATEISSNSRTISNLMFIEKCVEIHGDTYDYSKTIFTRYSNRINILCRIHGEYTTWASNHIQGSGKCPKCNSEKRDINVFIEKAVKTHGNKYDYSKAVYVNSCSKIEIICPIHGSFWQKANGHLNGKGCNKCRIDDLGFSRSAWIKKCANKIATFYIIRCFNDNESFYKFGITSNGLKKRYKQRVHMPYEYEIIRLVISTDREYIYNLENKFHRFKLKDKYTPKIPFAGSSTECFLNYTTTHDPNKFY
jgi:hypothetical protein